MSRLDWLHFFEYKDATDQNNRDQYAPTIPEETLLEALHVRVAEGKYFRGFAAIRFIIARIPLTTIISPLLWLPWMGVVGEKLYKVIAKNRCREGGCLIG
jgi:predicted DCC family thiol-disulfide oxidoreductase YuxK